MMHSKILTVKKLTKKFVVDNATKILFNELNFEIKEKEFISIIGKSGCGKSTFLRILCCLDDDYGGDIYFGNEKKQKPDRNVILMSQDFNQLFNWHTVLDNIVIPLVAKKLVGSRLEAVEMAQKFLGEVGLLEYQNSYPQKLSGGMRQRVAFVRAIALKPKILLLDEPFSSLDDVIRDEMCILLKKICDKHKIAVIFVTHNISEAEKLSDKIMLLKDGELINLSS
jgi:NitT/TauT family transport system ATP-binding protein